MGGKSRHYMENLHACVCAFMFQIYTKAQKHAQFLYIYLIRASSYPHYIILVLCILSFCFYDLSASQHIL